MRERRAARQRRYQRTRLQRPRRPNSQDNVDEAVRNEMHRMQLQDREATRANDAVTGRAVADQARVSVLAHRLSGLATEAEVAIAHLHIWIQQR
eukprot:SAG31_NODE_7620_length_1637_cov_45.855007_2_plen_94_part_00